MPNLYLDNFTRHRQILEATQLTCHDGLQHLAELATQTLLTNHRIYFFGNGGSAADAQHLATELSVRFIHNRRALAGLALTTDSSVLTACANDLGFDQIFARQLEALGQPGDLAIALSTSGNSPNVIAALETARQMNITPAALTGQTGGRLKGLADPLITVPATETARIQEMHILLGHILCTEIEHRLGLST
jgi:D-sedoheptulose 7-phosphate isomerase